MADIALKPNAERQNGVLQMEAAFLPDCSEMEQLQGCRSFTDKFIKY